MSQTLSLSLARRYGMARVTRMWKVSRASVYRSLKETPPNAGRRRKGAGDRQAGLFLHRRQIRTRRRHPPLLAF
jgi:hypothetical protein